MNLQDKKIMISGYTVPIQKELFIGLTSIYGIGISTAISICKQIKIDYKKRVKNLNSHEINLIVDFIEENIQIGDDLKKDKMSHIRRLMDIRCYKGIRLRKKLPANGQRTRSNSKTVRKLPHV